MKFKIYGSRTFEIKEELKGHACIWNPIDRCWESPYYEDKNELGYKMLKGLVEAFDCELIPLKLSDECKKIQNILRELKI